MLDSSLLKIPFPGTKPVITEDFYVKYYAALGLTDESMYRERMDMLKRTIHAAQVLGAPNIRVFAFWRIADPRTIFNQLADHMSAMAEVAEHEKVKLLFENEGSTNMATSDETADLMRMVKSPAVGVNYDPQNSFGLEAEPFPSGFVNIPKERIGNVHVKAEGLFGPKHPIDWTAIMKAWLVPATKDASASRRIAGIPHRTWSGRESVSRRCGRLYPPSKPLPYGHGSEPLQSRARQQAVLSGQLSARDGRPALP